MTRRVIDTTGLLFDGWLTGDLGAAPPSESAAPRGLARPAGPDARPAVEAPRVRTLALSTPVVRVVAGGFAEERVQVFDVAVVSVRVHAPQPRHLHELVVAVPVRVALVQDGAGRVGRPARVVAVGAAHERVRRVD